MVIETELISIICILFLIIWFLSRRRNILNNKTEEPPQYVDYFAEIRKYYHTWTSSKINYLYELKASKSATLKRIVLLIFISFFLYFLFFSSLLGKDNISYIALAADDICSEGVACAYSGNCDLSQYGQSGDGCQDCVDIGTWTGDGGENNCCGDDNGEDYCSGGFTACFNEVFYTDGDDNSYTCNTCGTGTWTGDGGQNNCCGDDVSEDYCSGGFTACLDASYYSDGDSNQYTCETCGTGTWFNDGGSDNCCGDDGGENTKSNNFDIGSMEGSSDGTNACCATSDYCVNSSTCFASGSSYNSVDDDPDSDYCFEGTWYDCQDNTDCPGTDICSTLLNDCINPYGYIRIRSLGETGIENTSENYTSVRSVFLDLNYTSNAEACRYNNHDDIQNPPNNNDEDWTEWENCVKTRVWILSEGLGTKVVYYQINYSDPNQLSLFNDSIYYDYTGAGLDVSPASKAIIDIDDFSNDNTSVEVSWSGASDPESDVLGIPLQYRYVVYTNDTPIKILENKTTLSTSIVATNKSGSNPEGFNLKNGTLVFVNVTVINSAGLETVSSTFPSGLVIDLEKPYMLPRPYSCPNPFTYGNFTNGTNSEKQNLPCDEDQYIWAPRVQFYWSAFDRITNSVTAYSYILSQNPNAQVDTIPEGSVGQFALETDNQYSNLESGKYYFKVRPKDLAGNWGKAISLNFSTDTSGPSKPEVTSIEEKATSVTVRWTSSSDSESGISKYRVNLTYQDGTLYRNRTTTSTNYTFQNVATGDYNATVGALNGVGIWTWSNQDESQVDSTPPEVYATPNRTVDTSEPVIRAWTNEQAVCYNNSFEFSYTNTTYHEFKLYDQNFGTEKTVVITCIDLAGNEQQHTFNFSIENMVSDSINGPSSFTSYEDILTTYTFSVNDGSEEVAGISADRFNAYINKEEIEFSVFDRGTGYYNLSFNAPEAAGTNYELRIVIDEGTSDVLDKNISLTVNEIYLSGSYESPSVSDVKNTTHMSYYASGSGRIGLASNAPDNRLSIESKGTNLSLVNIPLENELFIFNTRSSSNINSREDLLDQDIFLEKINPSFGYQIDDTYIINFILRYDNFIIQSGLGDTLNQGHYNVLVRNTVSSSGKRTLRFTRADGQSGRIVLQE